MRVHLDLRGKKFLGMEYDFVSVAAFEAPEKLSETLSLLVFSFVCHDPEEYEGLMASLPDALIRRNQKALVYSGWAKLTFSGVVGGYIDVDPYLPRLPPSDWTVALSPKGIPPNRLHREWPSDASHKEAFEYVLSCSLESPFGAMCLAIRASGAVELSVDPEEFTMNWAVYDRFRSKQLRETS
jgi:hypothetical protein